ncbi:MULTISPECIES: IS607 family transposase [unclassified Microcoleus]|jgi:putative resolvase|uniref:IS607 family transposase n=1 Tax=unclassified Microcoleus TaxID=2642155 RepID=UPI002FD34876
MWKVAEFAKLVGVSSSTLRRWEREGKLIPERTLGNQRVYSETHLNIVRNLKTGKTPPNRAIVYCRVSSPGQKQDLLRQTQAMEQFCLAQGVAITDSIQEIGGGLNFKRPKFLQILQWAILGEVRVLYVAHQDRLCRFGFELVEQILQWNGGTIIVANAESLSPHEELTQDLLSIIHCFSSRLYALRKYKAKVKNIVEGVDPCSDSSIVDQVKTSK